MVGQYAQSLAATPNWNRGMSFDSWLGVRRRTARTEIGTPPFMSNELGLPMGRQRGSNGKLERKSRSTEAEKFLFPGITVEDTNIHKHLNISELPSSIIRIQREVV